MNARPFYRSGLAALTALLTFGLGFEASAQSVTTTPVGVVSKTLSVGINSVGLPLINNDILRTTVSSVSSSTVTVPTSNVGSLLTAGEPYYIEVYSGDLKGDRFDVDVSATVSNANNTIVLQDIASENTLSINSIGTLLNGASIALRKHITIEQVHQSIGALVGNNSALLADKIHIFDTNANGYLSYFLRVDGVTWRRVGTTVSANKLAIHPGKGIFFEKLGSNAQITLIGNVRTNDFVRKYTSGLQLLSNPWPVDFSPDNYQALSSNGWVGSNSAISADRIHIYNVALGGYESYFLRADGVTWRKVGTTTNVSASKIMAADASFFVQRVNSDAGFLYVNGLGL